MNDILKVIRTERHDFLNHLQVISGLLQLNKQEKVHEYIEKVTKELYSLGRITRLGESWIATALLLKNYEAVQKGINFEIVIETDLDEFRVEGQNFAEELKEILETLFNQCKADNQNELQPNLKLVLGEEENQYVFEINCPIELSNEAKEAVMVSLEKIKVLKNVNAKYFDTDKKVRIYITAAKGM